MTMLFLVLTVYIFKCIQGAEVCYNHIGCFQNTPPFNNSFGKLPKSPDDIRVIFTLQTNLKNSSQQLDPYNESTITGSHFTAKHKTVLIVHGFHSTHTSEWIQPLVEAFMAESFMNVIVTDWSGGAFDSYDQAVANTRVVGAVIAELVTALHNITNMDYSRVHLVGHSLGSHICGYAGERIPGLGRITGLDPAGPFFDNTDPVVRIDPTDAILVDIIHTDGTRYGLNSTFGDVDFFPNGGIHQPACMNDESDPSIACSHVRAIYYFTESINSECHFKSYPCKSKDDFDAKRCTSCGTGCQLMGYHVNPNATGSYYLSTNWHYPFCSNKP